MLKQQVLRGTSWLLLGRLFSNAVGLVSTLVAARFLLPEDFGLVAIAMGVFTIAGSFVELPIAAALVQLKTATKDDFNTAWTINLLRGLIVACIMAASAWPVSHVFDDPRLMTLILAMSTYPILLGLRNSWFEQYIRDMDFRWEALVECLTKIVSFITVVVICLTTGSYWALPLSMVASGVAAMALSYILCPRFPGFGLSEFRKFFGFSIWLGLGHVADSIRDSAGTFLIGKYIGQAKLGSYSLGMQFGDRLELVLYSPLERTLFAAFSSIQDDAVRVRETYLKSIHMGFAFILPVCAGVGLLAPEVIAIALGPTWSDAALVLSFAAPAMALYLLAGLSSSLAIALGHTRKVFQMKAISAAVSLPLLSVGVITAGLYGALWAFLATAVIWYMLCVTMIFSIAKISVRDQVAAIARSTGAAAIMAVCVVSVRTTFFAAGDGDLAVTVLRAVCLSGLGALTYIASHFSLWRVAGQSQGVESAALGLLSRRLASR